MAGAWVAMVFAALWVLDVRGMCMEHVLGISSFWVLISNGMYTTRSDYLADKMSCQ